MRIINENNDDDDDRLSYELRQNISYGQFERQLETFSVRDK